MNYTPNFKNLKNIFLCRDKESVPLIELHIDKEFKEKFLSREIKGIEDEVNFCLANKHDFILLAIGMLKPAQVLGSDNQKDEKHWAEEGKGIISSVKGFEMYNWPNPKKEDYSIVLKTKSSLPKGMGLIITCGKVFTASWMLMGFENFCISLYENKSFVKKIIKKVGSLQFEYFKNIMDTGQVDAIAVVDDIAYTEGLMISADILRENVFLWYEKMGKICKDRDIPFIYHSDGNISQIIDDLIVCGFNAIHPIEPKAMDILKLHKKYKNRLCLLGNIEMDKLIRGSAEEVEELVRHNLENIAKNGFYACGSSNSLIKEIPLENYYSLVNTVKGFKL